jgi:AcrR family transcriptional regulator
MPKAIAAQDPDNTAVPAEAPKRRYTSTRRAAQAAQTRDDVLRAAIASFTEHGWAGTTLGAVAAAAGVAVETIYSGFGSKKGLLRAAWDVSVVGDDAPLPLSERPEYHAMGHGSLAERCIVGARLTAEIHERSAGVWRAVIEAALTDAEVAAWRDEQEEGRRHVVSQSLELISGHRVDGEALDFAWAILGPETYLKLCREAGWIRATYERVIAASLDLLTEAGAH